MVTQGLFNVLFPTTVFKSEQSWRGAVLHFQAFTGGSSHAAILS
jgi:hypothetical protein